MAIEFNCPFCAVPIRVPDSSGGKQGKCPACTSRILVPRVSAAPAPESSSKAGGKKGVSKAAPPSFPSAPQFSNEPQFSSPPDHSEPAFGGEKNAAGVEAAATPLSAPGPISPDELPFEESKQTNIARAVRRRRRRGGGLGLVWTIIGLGLVAVIGGLAYVNWPKPKLEGSLKAEAMPVSFLPPPQYLSPESYGIEAEAAVLVLNELRERAETFVSDRMRLKLHAVEKKGIEVTLEAGETTQFVVFNPRADSALAAYCTSHLTKFEAQRNKDLDAAATKFFKAIQEAAETKTPIADKSVYRDSVGLTALVNGVGYSVEAQSGNVVSRCVFEDGEGRLFFLLPTGAKSFQLRGRKMANGKTPFEGKFTVSITPAPAAADPEKKNPTNGMEDPEEDGLAPKSSKSKKDDSEKSMKEPETKT